MLTACSPDAIRATPVMKAAAHCSGTTPNSGSSDALVDQEPAQRLNGFWRRLEPGLLLPRWDCGPSYTAYIHALGQGRHTG